MTGWIERKIAQRLTLLFKNLSPDRMDLRLLKGEGKLQDLEFQEDTLQRLMKLPPYLLIRSATCTKLTIKVPWTRLKQDPIVLIMESVEMNIIEPRELKFQTRGRAQSSTDDTQSASAMDQTLSSIQVEVKHLRVSWQTRGVDLPGYQQHPFICFDVYGLVSKATDSSFQAVDLRLLATKKAEGENSSHRLITVDSCSIQLGNDGVASLPITNGLSFRIEITTTSGFENKKSIYEAKIDVSFESIKLNLTQGQYWLLAQFVLALDACLQRNGEAFSKFQKEQDRFGLLSHYQSRYMEADSSGTPKTTPETERRKASIDPGDSAEFLFASMVKLKFDQWSITVEKEGCYFQKQTAPLGGVTLEGTDLFVTFGYQTSTVYVGMDDLGITNSKQSIIVASSRFSVKNSRPLSKLGPNFDHILKPRKAKDESESQSAHMMMFSIGSESCNSPKSYKMDMLLDISPVEIMAEEASMDNMYDLLSLPPRTFKRYIPEVEQHVPMVFAVKFHKPTFLIPRKTPHAKGLSSKTAIVVAKCSSVSVNLYPSIVNDSPENSGVDFSRNLLVDGRGITCEIDGQANSGFLDPIDLSWECEFITMKPGRVPGTRAAGSFKFKNIHVHINQEQFLFLYHFIQGEQGKQTTTEAEEAKLAEAENKEQSMARIVADYESLQSVYITTKVETANLMAEVDSLNGQNATLNINLHHREKQIEQLMKEIELSKTGDKGKYLTEIRNLNRSIEEFRMARDELQARLSEKQRVYERETKLIRDKLQRTVSELHMQQENRRLEAEEMKEKIIRRESDLEKALREIEALKRENQVLRQSVYPDTSPSSIDVNRPN
eukprot:TRINITY_DN1632_c0_g2_i2.p1 TRINITY_DN1632_c0_g2~~TRINITY_DN1632_c0_g2_i2.p1  ORF type:complete len:833 (-),score=184.92 TRINITY_DN1632_c0_g2_i2:1889-4387(-)